MISEPHSPIKDAVASIKLFKKYEKNPAKLRQDVPKLAKGFPEPSIGKVLNFEYDGVCLAAFNPQKCICNAPTKRGT